MLSTFEWLDATSEQSKGQMAERLYSGQTFDCSLPQSWIQVATDCAPAGMHVASHFVWLYPNGSLLGRPAPLTKQGIELLAIMSLRV